LELPVSEVATFVASDNLEVKEEDVFAAVLAWVKEDEVARKAELDRLLPLVRFPLMKAPAVAMEAEPLVAQHPRAFQLMFETLPDFAGCARAASCPRLVPRKGTTPPLDLSWMGNAPPGTEGFTPQQQMVAAMIGAATSDTGCGIGDLESFLRAYGVTSSDIHDACDFLSAEGHIYPTIDDDHFQLCTG
jgi:hypothetical protein